MENSKMIVLNLYNKISLIIGLGIYLVLFLHFNKMPESMFGSVDKGIFYLDFAVEGQQVVVFNSPLVWFIGFFLLNLGALLFTQYGNKKETGLVVESMFYNTVISFLLIASQLAFFYMVPDSVNGIIDIGLFKYEFVELVDKSATGINFGYIFASVYVLYNIVVVFLETRNNQISYK